jgi:hypothetical protein
VTCRDVDGLLISGIAGASMPSEASAHIAGCERCRRLVQAMAQTPRVTAPPAEQLKKIEAGILADLKPVKPLAGTLWLGLLLAVAVVALIGAIDLGAAGWRALGLARRIAVFSELAAAAVLLALSASRQIVPGSRVVPRPAALVAAILAALGGTFAVSFRPHPEATFVATGLVCLRIGLECAIPSGLIFWLLLRRGAFLNPILIGATAGALAGLSGLTVLEIFCPNPNEYHILVWHMGAVLVSIVAGIAIGAIAEHTGWRRSRRTP